MDELKLIFAANLIRLRTAAGMTQLELGESLNYTDKAVSKWERGESLPDVATLLRIASRFGVTVDELLKPEDEWTLPVTDEELLEKKKKSNWLIVLTTILGILSVTGLVFIILWLNGIPEWRVFVYMLPVLFTTWLVLNSALLEGKGNRFIVLGLVPSVLAVVYAALLCFNPWQIFLLTIPAEAITWFSFKIKDWQKK